MDNSATSPPGASPRLALRGICKSFPGVLVNDHVDLTVEAGEIHALLGENGAGKSTLMKIVHGVLAADSGTMTWEGRPVRITSPAEARRLGIGMVFQHFALFDSLTVAENVALGLEGGGSVARLRDRIRAVSDGYGLALEPDRHVHELSMGERQRVEIVRCLLGDPKLIILDEPTSVLTPKEALALFAVLRRLRDEGRSVLYISHKLDEIRALCDRASVLRGGRRVATVDPRAETARSLARMMIGSDPPDLTDRADTAAEAARPLLEVDTLSLDSDDPYGTDLHEISLSVRPGEILGIAGVAGNGQNQLMRALSGERLLARAGAIRIAGRPVADLGPGPRRALGMAVVPEERLGQGAVPELSLAENALLSAWRHGGLVKGGLVRGRHTHGFARTVMSTFNVIAHGSDAEARSLSGGNLQKFIIGREILQDPQVLVAAHPTWGVDAGSAAAIHQALVTLRDRGAAVLVISQDLDELYVLSDRIAVIAGGHLSESRPTHAVTAEDMGVMMGGMMGGLTTGGLFEAAPTGRRPTVGGQETGHEDTGHEV
ncbi:ABC transporter ATP-binding protein [Roseospira visakhapatnamensis]|uniref:Simple sugar transport system ATP-binding protein n=1 Tax=Roseospira visakhapatnamensis TaxID=390880 RepID=A0A7W6WAL7_9PROT|nr:ABC transporter ATP-binding protein [Roseospira visakhapatnamensis]MBB4266631.1 simple sugar transport system ATP-binding protein [Roseospira visakhapatnamensis]